MFIREFAEGCCDECGRARKGVRFFYDASEAFLCWEHFRLAAPALRDLQPTMIRETVIHCEGHSCCRCTCSRHSWSRSICHSNTGRSWSETEGRSHGRSIGHSGYTESRGESNSEGA